MKRLGIAALALAWALPASAERGFKAVYKAPPGGRQGLRGEAVLYQRSFAVVVGIDKYRNANVPSLEGAARDAREVAKELQSQGFEVTTLLDAQATRAAVAELLGDRLPQTLGKEDRVLVYFAGHGASTGKGATALGYILPVDGDRERLRSSGISMKELYDWFADYPSKHVMFVADACYSGLILRTRAIGLPTNVRDYLLQVTQKPVRLAFTAGGSGEEAHEFRGHGLFTTFFLDAIRGAADANRDGIVTSDELAAYVRPGVSQTALAQYKASQNPQVGREGEGEFVFLTGAADPPADAAPAPRFGGVAKEDLQALQRRAARREEEFQAEKRKYHTALEAYFQEVASLDARPRLTDAEKKAAWEGFLAKFPADHPDWGANPHAAEALDKAAHWGREAAKAPVAAPASPAAPSAAPVAPRGQALAGGAVATVNGSPILSSDYRREAKSAVEAWERQGSKLTEDQLRALREKVLEQLVDQELLYQEGNRLNIKVRERDIDAGVEEVKSRFAKDDAGRPLADEAKEAAFADQLRAEGMTFAQFRARLSRQVLVRKAVESAVKPNVAPPEEREIRAYFEKITGFIDSGRTAPPADMDEESGKVFVEVAKDVRLMSSERVRVSRILVKLAEGASPGEKRRALATARDIKRRIDQGRGTFAEIARTESEDPESAAQGGDIGFIFRGRVPPEIEKAVFSMDAGDVSEPIETPNGYHIMRVVEKRDAGPPEYAAFREELSKFLMNVRFSETLERYVRGLKAKAVIQRSLPADYGLGP